MMYYFLDGVLLVVPILFYHFDEFQTNFCFELQ